jgi:hypothetical protein
MYTWQYYSATPQKVENISVDRTLFRPLEAIRQSVPIGTLLNFVRLHFLYASQKPNVPIGTF